jgi:hypothetical protein
LKIFVVFIIGVAVAVIRMIVFHGRVGHGDDDGGDDVGMRTEGGLESKSD